MATGVQFRCLVIAEFLYQVVVVRGIYACMVVRFRPKAKRVVSIEVDHVALHLRDLFLEHLQVVLRALSLSFFLL